MALIGFPFKTTGPCRLKKKKENENGGSWPLGVNYAAMSMRGERERERQSERCGSA